MTSTPKAVVLFSGGMDSATLMYLMKDQGYDPIGLSVHYGQRHRVELEYAASLCKALGATHKVVDLGVLKELVGRSSLTSDTPVPEGHYEQATMSQTVVPNRNTILLSIAYGYAVSIGATKVCTAVHAGDHAVYPDCRPEFIKTFELMEKEAITHETYGMSCPSLYAPFVMMNKADIAKMGAHLSVPWLYTWSCYNGDEEKGQCGRCSTCVERIGAFHSAGVTDPTTYQDTEYAVEVLKQHGEW